MNYWDQEHADVSDLVGKVLTNVYQSDNEIKFITEDGIEYVMYHYQDCCESVYIESITGELESLVGNEIFLAEESSNRDEKPKTDYEYDSYTWTFYKFATIKGYVDIRWFGSSNGYYSERVDFRKVKNV